MQRLDGVPGKGSRSVQLLVAAAMGAFVAVAIQFALPFIGRLVYQREFQSAYIDCALAEQHASRFAAVPMRPTLRVELGKTLDVEQLRCLDYAAVRLRLRSYHVSEETIAAMEVEALAEDPELHCDIHCINQLQ
jgi:hypothetical protein